MQQVHDLKLPPALLETLKSVAFQPGVSVRIPSTLVAEVDQLLDACIQEKLADVRERERSPSAESLKLRFR